MRFKTGIEGETWVRNLSEVMVAIGGFLRVGFLLMLFFLVLVFSNCNDKPKMKTPTRTVSFEIEYSVDDLSLILDSLMYTNAAGNKYSITRLNYYLSGFKFLQTSGSGYGNAAVYYFDAAKSSTNKFTFVDLPTGSYSGISFYLGLDSLKNKTNALPNTLENEIMAWPVPMGGGYHFLKFEGHFLDAASVKKGYAIHLGKNENVVKITILKSIEVGDDDISLNLGMNLSEFFKNPLNYDLINDPAYTMSDGVAMKKISDNAVDVFTLK